MALGVQANANGFASKWNIGLMVSNKLLFNMAYLMDADMTQTHVNISNSYYILL